MQLTWDWRNLPLTMCYHHTDVVNFHWISILLFHWISILPQAAYKFIQLWGTLVCLEELGEVFTWKFWEIQMLTPLPPKVEFQNAQYTSHIWNESAFSYVWNWNSDFLHQLIEYLKCTWDKMLHNVEFPLTKQALKRDIDRLLTC